MRREGVAFYLLPHSEKRHNIYIFTFPEVDKGLSLSVSPRHELLRYYSMRVFNSHDMYFQHWPWNKYWTEDINDDIISLD